METHWQLIKRLQDKIDIVLAPLLPKVPFALLDFPNHSNVGDSAIWIGERTFFSKYGCFPSYVSEGTNCNWKALKGAIGTDGIIFIHGGGNFGDIWPFHHEFRENVLAQFKNHKIIQLPQTIHFESADKADHTARLIDAHRNLTLLVRDRTSYEFATRTFQCEVILCPDMAFCIGPLTYSSAFGVDTLFLLRSDKESVGAKMTDALPSNSVSADWLIESSATCFIARLKAMAHAFGTILHGKIPDECARDSYYNHLANDRLQRGLKQLSSYGYIVSDRLHVHILCTLLGIPHTILDNNYGKVRSFSQTWSTNIDKAYFAGDIEQAITHLRRL